MVATRRGWLAAGLAIALLGGAARAEGPPDQPVVIDLRPLKPYARDFVKQVDPAEQWMLRDFIHGFDALVVIPASAKASFELTGFPSP